jgi:hypothetical protein
MAALSDYLESGLLHHIFRGQSFPKPSSIAIALTSGVPIDSNTGGTIPEVPSTINGSGTGYSRILLANTVNSGNSYWTFVSTNCDISGCQSIIKNTTNRVFDTALLNWGWVSGIAILDNETYGQGNLLMHAQLDNPRIIYEGDNVVFNSDTLQISFK